MIKVIFFVFLLSVNIVYSQSVINPYSDCLLNLAAYVGLTITPDSQNNYNFCLFYECDENDKVIGFNFTHTSNKIISRSLMECYPEFIHVTMNNWKVEQDFLLFTSNIKLFSLTMRGCSGYSLDYKVSVEKFILELHLPETIKFSNILKPLSKAGVTILGIPFSTGLVTLENDLLSITQIGDFKCFTRSIPDMSNIITTDKVHYILNPSSFDLNSFYNIRTHSNIRNLEIESSIAFDTTPLIDSLVNIKMPQKNEYKLTYCYFTFPLSSQINFSGNVIFDVLYFKVIGINNLIYPFTKLPYGLKNLYYYNGNIGNLFSYEVLKGTNITNFHFRNDSITGLLPKWDSEVYNKVIKVSLPNNRLTGIIDPSYCSVVLDVRNNDLTGELPECYACNLIDPLFKLNLDGNNFDNYQIKSCPFIPNLKMNQDGQLNFFGLNLGYDMNFLVNPYIELDMKVPNSLFSASGYIPNRIIHNFTSTITGEIYHLTPDPYPPQLYSIVVFQGHLVIQGQYFTYNSSLVSVYIGNSICNIYNTTFHEVKCLTLVNLNTSVTGSIEVDGLITNFKVNLENNLNEMVITNYTACPDYCNYPNGVCDYNTGTCSCAIGRRIDCSLKCLKSCLYGDCIEGNCVCHKGYYGSDCTIKTHQPCLNNCTDESHGVCDESSGVCKCNSNWSGLDCSSPKNQPNDNSPKTNSTINPDGSTTVVNENTSYNIYITSLLELDLNGNQVKIYPLENNWLINETIDSDYNSTVSFSQTLNNTRCKIELLVQEIKKESNYSFAGIDFNLNAGSVKVSVSINSYEYDGPLNTLQLQMISNVSSNSKDCNSKSAESTTSLFDDQLLNYITISRDNRVLYGRFINRALSDNKASLISTSLISNQNESITIGINIPHFTNKIQIDPDFSVILTNDFKSECGSSKKSYVIPVAVVVSVVGVAVVISVFYVAYKKRKSLLFKRKLVKLKDLNT